MNINRKHFKILIPLVVLAIVLVIIIAGIVDYLKFLNHKDEIEGALKEYISEIVRINDCYSDNKNIPVTDLINNKKEEWISFSEKSGINIDWLDRYLDDLEKSYKNEERWYFKPIEGFEIIEIKKYPLFNPRVEIYCQFDFNYEKGYLFFWGDSIPSGHDQEQEFKTVKFNYLFSLQYDKEWQVKKVLFSDVGYLEE